MSCLPLPLLGPKGKAFLTLFSCSRILPCFLPPCAMFSFLHLFFFFSLLLPSVSPCCLQMFLFAFPAPPPCPGLTQYRPPVLLPLAFPLPPSS